MFAAFIIKGWSYPHVHGKPLACMSFIYTTYRRYITVVSAVRDADMLKAYRFA